MDGTTTTGESVFDQTKPLHLGDEAPYHKEADDESLGGAEICSGPARSGGCDPQSNKRVLRPAHPDKPQRRLRIPAGLAQH